jgi:hypothetical protein
VAAAGIIGMIIEGRKARPTADLNLKECARLAGRRFVLGERALLLTGARV